MHEERTPLLDAHAGAPSYNNTSVNATSTTQSPTTIESIVSSKVSCRSFSVLAVMVLVPLVTLVSHMRSYSSTLRSQSAALPNMGAAWSSVAAPFSVVNPMEIGVIGIDRPHFSRPGPIFDKVLEKKIPLPTNSWLESLFLGETTWGPNNRVFQVPYIVDTGGYIQGVRAHPAHVQANNRQVEMTFESRNGLTGIVYVDYL